MWRIGPLCSRDANAYFVNRDITCMLFLAPKNPNAVRSAISVTVVLLVAIGTISYCIPFHFCTACSTFVIRRYANNCVILTERLHKRCYGDELPASEVESTAVYKNRHLASLRYKIIPFHFCTAVFFIPVICAALVV